MNGSHGLFCLPVPSPPLLVHTKPCIFVCSTYPVVVLPVIHPPWTTRRTAPSLFFHSCLLLLPFFVLACPRAYISCSMRQCCPFFYAAHQPISTTIQRWEPGWGRVYLPLLVQQKDVCSPLSFLRLVSVILVTTWFLRVPSIISLYPPRSSFLPPSLLLFLPLSSLRCKCGTFNSLAHFSLAWFFFSPLPLY